MIIDYFIKILMAILLFYSIMAVKSFKNLQPVYNFQYQGLVEACRANGGEYSVTQNNKGQDVISCTILLK